MGGGRGAATQTFAPGGKYPRATTAPKQPSWTKKGVLPGRKKQEEGRERGKGKREGENGKDRAGDKGYMAS